MMPPLRKQPGAVTLMGALVIIITMMLMIEVLHRMAASDILDTSVQNDSVEALFIAETGIEHASYLFANTTACADLALVGPVNAGRGSFDIGSSTLVGSECNVSVTATAGVLGARRVVEAVLKNEGNLLGDGMGDLWDVVSPLRKDFRFNQAGTAKIELHNYMTKLETLGIIEVGLIVKKSGQ